MVRRVFMIMVSKLGLVLLRIKDEDEGSFEGREERCDGSGREFSCELVVSWGVRGLGKM
jgi:hypothetical protein